MYELKMQKQTFLSYIVWKLTWVYFTYYPNSEENAEFICPKITKAEVINLPKVNTVPHVVLASNHKIILLQLHNYNLLLIGIIMQISDMQDIWNVGSKYRMRTIALYKDRLMDEEFLRSKKSKSQNKVVLFSILFYYGNTVVDTNKNR